MKRKLRPCVRSALSAITLALGILLIGINDFSISALPLILLMIAIVIVNVKILDTF